jgi:hypothetical protein
LYFFWWIKKKAVSLRRKCESGHLFLFYFFLIRFFTYIFYMQYDMQKLGRMTLEQLTEIAGEFGLKVRRSASLQSIIYDILDAQADRRGAEVQAKEDAKQAKAEERKRNKRTRIQSAPQKVNTDNLKSNRVLATVGNEQETLGQMKDEQAKQPQPKPVVSAVQPMFGDIEPVPAASDITPDKPQAPEQSPKKKSKKRNDKPEVMPVAQEPKDIAPSTAPEEKTEEKIEKKAPKRGKGRPKKGEKNVEDAAKQPQDIQNATNEEAKGEEANGGEESGGKCWMRKAFWFTFDQVEKVS